ncbi:hypothetical protein FA95DRAFT_1297983 [Auriscalpium vulgare]|uniref:Uncharacterized protein n=1 Tax=Auriscalpium vulgare TaxID=40419 RepID=A0ACB8R2D8_9AGAM|nr:hypothetical protein FA95DRAFT_1297983 [Auriscalpium vulgare]
MFRAESAWNTWSRAPSAWLMGRPLQAPVRRTLAACVDSRGETPYRANNGTRSRTSCRALTSSRRSLRAMMRAATRRTPSRCGICQRRMWRSGLSGKESAKYERRARLRCRRVTATNASMPTPAPFVSTWPISGSPSEARTRLSSSRQHRRSRTRTRKASSYRICSSRDCRPQNPPPHIPRARSYQPVLEHFVGTLEYLAGFQQKARLIARSRCRRDCPTALCSILGTCASQRTVLAQLAGRQQ